jgi:BON domain-containing protein
VKDILLRDAALIQNGLQKGLRYDVKNGVVTLKGNVNSGSKRAQVEKVTSTVPNVRQVVNELEVRDKKLVPQDEQECRTTRGSGSSLRACRSKSATVFRHRWRKLLSPTGWRIATRM